MSDHYGIIYAIVLLWILFSLGLSSHAAEHDKTRLWGVFVLFTGVFGMSWYAIALAAAAHKTD